VPANRAVRIINRSKGWYSGAAARDKLADFKHCGWNHGEQDPTRQAGYWNRLRREQDFQH
jgi:hypothetical protein